MIIPAYNTAQFIAETLDSVLGQTYSNFEAIVINDGSPDTEQMERVIAAYRDRIVYIKQKNKRAREREIRAITTHTANISLS